MAVDYTTGRRVAFGRAGSPPARLPDAVAASCAIPGFYRCVEIDGRPYVDGGVRSTSNLDVLRRERLDLVVALNPTSSLHVDAPRTIADCVAFELRQASGRRLGSEAKRLRAAGIDVVLIQPTVHDLDAIGSNLMSSRRRHQVIETAVRTVTEHLRNSPLGARLAKLPAGDPRLVRRPAGPPSSWPDFRAAASERWLKPHPAQTKQTVFDGAAVRRRQLSMLLRSGSLVRARTTPAVSRSASAEPLPGHRHTAVALILRPTYRRFGIRVSDPSGQPTRGGFGR